MARKDVVDAQELSETLTMALRNLNVQSPTRNSCRQPLYTNGLEIVDALLSMPGAVTGDEMDLLLDFRSLLRSRREAEALLRCFCDLRRRLEQRHYLALYRLRRWLESEIAIKVRSCPAASAIVMPLRLDFYCVEAVRRGCLCAALQDGVPLLAPRLNFCFRPAVRTDSARKVGDAAIFS